MRRRPSPTRAGSDVSRTQEAILAAYAELIEELGTDDVSFRLIARRAGVGERTVFRNYATRVDLLLATAAWIETDDLPAQDSPSDLRHAPHDPGGDGVVRPRPELAHVVAETTMRGVSGAAPSPRRAQLEQMIDAEMPCARRRRAQGDRRGAWRTSTRPRPGSRSAASSA